jgi:O-acetyl-ADP-ribose deacetylase (regulator of RNase III)
VGATEEIRTVALCGVSTGIFGLPLKLATSIALQNTRKWLENEENRNKVDKIIFCTFLEREIDCYSRMFASYFPVKNSAQTVGEKE